jgi:hypothetical protein
VPTASPHNHEHEQFRFERADQKVEVVDEEDAIASRVNPDITYFNDRQRTVTKISQQLLDERRGPRRMRPDLLLRPRPTSVQSSTSATNRIAISAGAKVQLLVPPYPTSPTKIRPRDSGTPRPISISWTLNLRLCRSIIRCGSQSRDWVDDRSSGWITMRRFRSGWKVIP